MKIGFNQKLVDFSMKTEINRFCIPIFEGNLIVEEFNQNRIRLRIISGTGVYKMRETYRAN